MPSTRTNQQVRQNEALQLRLGGMTYEAIASQLNYASTGSVRAAVVAAAQRQGITVPGGRVNRVAASVVTGQPIVTGTNSPLPSTRTFGCEFEFNGISMSEAVRALNAAGVDAFEARRDDPISLRWKVIRDGSVRGTGLELVSPILTGIEGIVAVRQALKALDDAGARTDTSCGFHLHVGANGLNGVQLTRIVELYAANHDAINLMVSPSRRNPNHQYASRLTTDRRYDAPRLDALRNATTQSELRQAANAFERYLSINLKAFAKHGTIEFRQHQGTVSGKKAEAWVRTMLAIVTAGEFGTVSGQQGDRTAFINSLPMSDDDKVFVTALAARFPEPSASASPLD